MIAPGHAGRAPLAGVIVRRQGSDIPVVVAADLLERLGATIVTGSHRRSDLVVSSSTSGKRPTTGQEPEVDGETGAIARLVGPAPVDVAGLPAGTTAYAAGLALAGTGALALWAGDLVEVDSRAVAVQVLLPAVMAAEYGTVHREPPAPRAISHGFVASDLASDDDEDTFDRLLDSLGADAVARQVADEAQAWRLPVCAYLRRPTAGEDHPFSLLRVGDGADPIDRTPASPPSRQPAGEGTPRARRRAPLSGVTVCDLTAMWAGPLATWLLATAGATVHKIEPDARLDGLRATDGRGIHPTGVDPAHGSASGMFNALNRGKQRRALDLREPVQRAEFESLVTASDLVIDSFSRRVMPNLGLSPVQLRALNPRVATLSLPAFPEDHPWQVALGPGVHAASGLGDLGDGRMAAPAVAYPDPLAGLTSFAVAVALLFDTRRHGATAHGEVSLLGAAAPLAGYAAASSILLERDPGLGHHLLDDPALAACGHWEHIDDGAGHHRYPTTPFRGPWLRPTLAPAPGLDREMPAVLG